MFKNIVLATDGSDHAAKAADVAADMAAQYGATLTLVTVMPKSLTLTEIEVMSQSKKFPQGVKDDMARFHKIAQSESNTNEWQDFAVDVVPAPFSAIIALGEAILDDAAAKAKAKGVKKIKRAVVTGHPAEAIVAAAKKANTDLIVLGTRGLSDLKGIFVGSVSHQVMHLADCPCLTVK